VSSVALLSNVPSDVRTVQIHDAIEAGGHDCTILDDDGVGGATDFDALGYDVVAFYRSDLSEADLLAIRAQGLPTLVSGNESFLKNLAILSEPVGGGVYGVSGISGTSTTPREDHAVNDGITLDVATQVIAGGSFWYGIVCDTVGPPAGSYAGTNIQSNGAARYGYAWAIEQGEADESGNPFEARCVAFGWLNRYYTSLTSDAETFIQNAVDWLTEENVPEGGTTGEAPELRVGAIGAESALLAVEPESEYLEVRFYLYEGVAALPPVSRTGPDRHAYVWSSLTADTEYTAYANVRYAAGWSPISNAVTFTTRVVDWDDEGAIGCPPAYPGAIINPDGNPPNRLGVGFFRPQPGEPMRGTVRVVFRQLTSEVNWDFYLSDDLGATWSQVASGVESVGSDDDLLIRYRFDLDTESWPDGQDYRLKAVDPDGDFDDILSLSFPIDNSESVYWWRQSYTDLDGRFGRLWAEKTKTVYGSETDEDIWVRSKDGGVAALKGHHWTALVDLDCPPSYGGDVTMRFYVWSGESGRFYLQGRDDTEGIFCGIAIGASGVDSDSQQGLVLGVENLVSWVLGCCSEYLTSSSGAGLHVSAALSPGGLFAYPGPYTSQLPSSPIEKMWFKATKIPPYNNLDPEDLATWPIMYWRDGPEPGQGIVGQRYSCARRYEAYTLRVRAERQAGDHTKMDVKLRLDGLGVTEPESGYWHMEKTLDRSTDWPCGLLGLADKQLATATYGTPGGARVFQTWSALPIEPECGEIESPPIEPPFWNPPEPGEPCTLILQCYEEDGKRVAWEVGTDEYHPNPYLCVPENYGEQELDIVHGAATLAQVEWVVVDRPQVVADQDSGWMTERLGSGGVGILHGRRMRMLRYIDYERGWVVIADGPCSAPRMDDSYAAFRGVIRDTRDTERKVRAFVRSDAWLLPMGLEDGWGAYVDEDGDDQWLVPATDPLVGEYSYDGTDVHAGSVSLDDYWLSGPPPGVETVAEDIVVSGSIEQAFIAEAQELGDPYPILWTWPDLEVLWRLEGSSDDWTVVVPTDLWPGVPNQAKPVGAGKWWRSLAPCFDVELADGTEIRAPYGIMLRGRAASGTFPTDGQRVEIAVRFAGSPTSWAPKHIEGITTGQLLKNLYDGLYSYRDALTGEVIPTRIRYNEADLLKMTDPVRLRITEPVDDARDWAEEMIYAPTGWVPALDNDGQISPKSQVPPRTFDGELRISNAVTEPSPEWSAGERIVNVLRYTYPRYYRVDIEDADAIDRLVARDVTHEYRDPSSIELLHNEQSVEYNGLSFASPGDPDGEPFGSVFDEWGYGHFFKYRYQFYDLLALVQDRALRARVLERMGNYVMNQFSAQGRKPSEFLVPLDGKTNG